MSLPTPAPDRAAIVTGASSGIGAEIARNLVARGHQVILVARTESKLTALAAELGSGAHVLAADLSDRAVRAALPDRVAALGLTADILINNAGLSTLGPVHRSNPEAEMQMVEVDVVAVVDLCSRFLPGMVERGTGAVLNVASTASFQPLPGMATYAATKAFVRSFSEAVHTELAGSGVSVTALCPGFTETEFGEVAGAGSFEAKMPSFVVLNAKDVAREAVDGMESGSRSVVPGLVHKAHAFSSRFMPNTLLLPIARRVTEDRLAR